MSDSQCLVLTAQHCPAADTTYMCTLHSQNLAPFTAPVSVTIIRGMWALGPSRLTSKGLVLGTRGLFFVVPLPQAT